jgi:uncharacterized membrane protein
MFPTQKINSIYGLRTILSMKNQDTWNEAQKYSANSLLILGFIFVALGFILSKLIETVSNGYQVVLFLIGIVIMLIFDEVHLRKIFNNDGSRRYSSNINSREE